MFTAEELDYKAFRDSIQLQGFYSTTASQKILSNSYIKEPEVCSPEVQGLDSNLCQAHILHDQELNHGMVTAAQTASDLH